MSPSVSPIQFQEDVEYDLAMSLLQEKINVSQREGLEDAFFIGDLNDIIAKHALWKHMLPRVEPHYAVKCNNDSGVLATLAQLGTGFDCASKAEIQSVLALKSVAPSQIIYANPCKQTSHIKYAAKAGVRLMTFDNEHELHKTAAVAPNAKLVLRILPPDSKAQCQLGMKFGCHPDNTSSLLKIARELGLDVMGISFHVGSGCEEAGAFAAAVRAARCAWDEALRLGFSMTLLDIGGGFPGQDDAKVSFVEICTSLRPALDELFPHEDGLRIIAEPGRFFVASAFTLAVNVIAKRIVPDVVHGNAAGSPRLMYYVNDGVYGSFNCLLYDHAEVVAHAAYERPGAARVLSSVWGPTCDGLDCIIDSAVLPELEVGDWLVFRNMGAYTMAAGSEFNGMPRPGLVYTRVAEKQRSASAATSAPRTAQLA